MLALVLLSIATAFAASPNTLPAGYALLSMTRLPVIDLEGDGKTIVSRRFDAADRLIELKVVRSDLKPELIDVLNIDYSPRERRIRVVYRGSLVVRRQVEEYNAGGALVRRETQWIDGPGKTFNQRVVEEPKSGATFSDKKKLTPRAKQQISARATGKKATERYYECVKSKPGSNGVSCETLQGLPLAGLQLSELMLPKYADLACEREGVLNLPNGYGIDLKSCRVKDDPNTEGDENAELLEGMRAAVNTATGPMLGCLRQINKPLAQRFELTLQERRPTLYCAQEEKRFSAKEHCKGAEDRADCEASFKRRRGGSGGFFAASRPNAIYLTGSDPVSELAYATLDADGGNALLGEVLFHETLHACSHAMSPPDHPLEWAGHDDNPPTDADAVYGCDALCGGAPQRITREGCHACVYAKVNGVENPEADRLRERCDAFPMAESKRAVEIAMRLDTELEACEEQLASNGSPHEACDSMAALDVVSKTCGKLSPANAECRKKLRVLAGDLLLNQSHAPHELVTALAYAAHDEEVTPSVRVEGGEIKPAIVVSKKRTAVDASARAGLLLYNSIVTAGFCQKVRNLGEGPGAQGEFEKVAKFYVYLATRGGPMGYSPVGDLSSLKAALRACETFEKQRKGD